MDVVDERNFVGGMPSFDGTQSRSRSRSPPLLVWFRSKVGDWWDWCGD
jgi:hypothetical protein